jgi:metal-dependent amidase/aminoacylase/carboxypeptidase family protein
MTMLLASCSSSTPAPDEPTPAPDEPTPANIAERAESLRSELIELRREIHRHPELSGQEVQTAALVEARLRARGLEVRTNVGGHGVVGVLRGRHPGPVVVYRADMDAMPDQEPPGREYGSTVPGVFHVCGHDLHTAIGIGVANVLAGMQEQMRGTAVFLFQPAEETIEGATAMLRDGALDGLAPDVIYAMHSFPNSVGTVARGTAFAGFDQFTISLDTAHSTNEIVSKIKANLAPIGDAVPPTTADEMTTFVTELQMPSGPYEKAVFLRVSSSTIDDRIVIRGSVKASSDSAYPGIRDAVREAVAREIPADSYEVSFRDGGPFPSMHSDERVSAQAATALADVIGAPNVLAMRATVPFASEDFAYFLQRTPGAMFFLGVANHEKGILGFPHYPDFDVDEEALVVGTKAMSNVIWQRLSEP